MALRNYGPADNPNFFNKYLAPNPYFGQLFVSAVNSGAFSRDFLNEKAVYMAYIAWYGRGYFLNDTAPSTENVIVGAWGDLLAPCISEAMILNEAAARTHLIDCVIVLFTTGAHNVISSITYDNLANRPAELQNAWNATAKAAGIPNHVPGAGGVQVDRTANAEVSVDDHGMLQLTCAKYGDQEVRKPTLDQTLALLEILATGISNNYKNAGPISMLTSVLVSVAKRGQMSEDYTNKIRDGIRADFGSNNITFNERPCEIFWRVFGSSITDESIGAIIQRWTNQTPITAVRLRTTLQQAKYQGLTVYCMIGRAIRKYPTFNWAVIERLFSIEWANFARALNEVGDNEWYGYRKDLGPAKSTNFKSLAWIAKNILYRVGGDGNIKSYRGGVTKIEHQATVDGLIVALENQLAQNVDIANIEEPQNVTAVKTRAQGINMFV